MDQLFNDIRKAREELGYKPRVEHGCILSIGDMPELGEGFVAVTATAPTCTATVIPAAPDSTSEPITTVDVNVSWHDVDELRKMLDEELSDLQKALDVGITELKTKCPDWRFPD